MKTRPEVGSFVRQRGCGLSAQVCQHFTDRNDWVKVIVLPQPGFTNGMDRYKRWHIRDIEPSQPLNNRHYDTHQLKEHR